MLLEGKRVVIAGGASGIGAATVQAAVEHGAAVVSLDIDERNGWETAETAGGTGPGTASFLPCDVTDHAAVGAAMAAAVDILGGLDGLVVLAGTEQQKRLEDTGPQDIRDMFGVNLDGPVHLAAAGYPHLRAAGGGSVINYSSAAGVDGSPGMPLYSAAKGAVLSLTRALAKDWGRDGIRVNAVCPAILTPLLETFLAEMTPQRRRERDATVALRIPLGGAPGAPRDAADVNIFLLSDLSRFVTGQTLPVDGGYVMMR